MYFLLCACANNLVFSLLAKGLLCFFAVIRASLGANFVVALCEFLLSLVLIIVQSAGVYSCRVECLFFVYYCCDFER